MAVKCSSCHSDNTDTARFCSNCATALITAAATPSLTPSPPLHPCSVTQTLETSAPAPAVAPGIVLSSRYEILGKIGEGGFGPLWARDGRRLFYRWEHQLWAVDVLTDGGFSTTKPRLLFDRRGYDSGDPIRSYDLSLDSQRFLMAKIEQREPSPVTEMTLVQNWFEELKRLIK